MTEEERRRLAEKEERERQETNGKDESADPRPREQDGEREGPGSGAPREDRAPAWVVSLPPQWRDAYVRGDFEKIPAEYRELIERYLLWLQQEAARETRGTR